LSAPLEPAAAADAASLLQTGRSLAAQGKFAAAAALLRKASALDAVSPDPELLLGAVLRDAGYAFLDNGMFAAAREAYRRASTRDAAGFDGPYAEAVLLYEGGKYDEALALFEPLGKHARAAEAPLFASYLRAARWYRLAGQKGDAASQQDAATRRCDSCWSPLGETHWTLENGRPVCERCFAEGLNDDAALAPIVNDVTAALDGALGIRLRRAPSARLVSREEMARLTRENLNSFEGVTGEIAGLYTAAGREPTVYILRGLPRRTAVETVAHELAHAWQGENCPPGAPLSVTEGFSQFAAYTALRQAGLGEAAERMFLERGPYGVNFKRMEVLGRVHGPKALLEMVREGMQ
jgi:tetratricopeptide (TPR) repeat protein